MFCYKCGKIIQENMSFCPYCGEKILNNSSENIKTNPIEANNENHKKTSFKNDTTRGLKIAGGVIEIVAGAFWLGISLLVNKIGNKLFGVNLEIIQLIMPMLFIYFGAMACTSKPKKNDYIVYAILNMAFVTLQFYYGTYIGLGTIQMVLLFIAGMLFVFVKPTQEEIKYNEALKKYKNNEPKNNKLNKKMLTIFSLGIAAIITLFRILSSMNIKIGDIYYNFDYLSAVIIGLIFYVGIIIYFIIFNVKQKKYRLTLNIIWTSIGILLLVIIDTFFIKYTYNNGVKISNGLFVSIISFALHLIITLTTYQTQYNIEFKKVYFQKDKGN